MKVLITNRSLNTFGGSEVWCLNMVQALIELGCEVEVKANAYGELASQLWALGATQARSKHFDLILCNHPHDVDIRSYSGYKIQTIHSKFVRPERPCDWVDKLVAITGEVADHFGIDDVIHNPVNTLNYVKGNDTGVILCLCQGDQAAQEVIDISNSVGMKCSWHSKWHDPLPQEELYQKIAAAKLVVGVGRGVYESLSIGARVVVFDSRGYDKQRKAYALYPHNRALAEYANYTGRAIVDNISTDSPRRCIEARIQDPPMRIRKYNHIKIAQKYLDLYLANKY